MTLINSSTVESLDSFPLVSLLVFVSVHFASPPEVCCLQLGRLNLNSDPLTPMCNGRSPSSTSDHTIVILH